MFLRKYGKSLTQEAFFQLGQILLAITYGGATAHLPNGAFFWWGGIVSLFFVFKLLQT